MFRRSRFADVIERQLALFERENADLLADVDEAFEAYHAAHRDEAEARYETYLDQVETAQDELVALRDVYAATLDEDTAEEYEAAFNAAVRKKLPRYGLELD
jgi:hypothetical protein